MQSRFSSAGEHDVVISIDSGPYDQRAPAHYRARVRPSGIRGALHLLWRRRLGLVLALACASMGGMLVHSLRRDCASSSATLHTMEMSLAAGAQPVPAAASMRDLVVVAGHAVFTGARFADASSPDSWYLEEYQRVPGQADSFVEHMRAGVEAAAANPAALLLFSGGATRAPAGPLSEAVSYWSVANALDWFDAPQVRPRAFTEEHARDSYENLLFSLCRFHELTGSWPRNVTVVGYEFKRERFTALHRRAVAFPAHRFRYVGTPAVSPAAAAGEAAAAAAFREDPYGCSGALGVKRHGRDPFARGVPYLGRCAAAHALLAHCGPAPFMGHLPWEGDSLASDAGGAGGGAGTAAALAAAGALDT